MNPLQSCDIPRRCVLLKHFVLVLLLSATLSGMCAQTQPAPKPLSKDDVIKLLAGSVSPKRVGELADERGIDFQVTPEVESQLRTAGADEGLIAILRGLAPKPATLVVTTNPGGAQVFIDDELIAKTSSEGRLKISDLGPGPHKLRLSVDGYREREEAIELVAGDTVVVPVVLERNAQSSPSLAQSQTMQTPAPLGKPGASAGGPAANRTLTLTGNLYYFPGFGIGLRDSGTLRIGEGRLEFIATKNAKDSLDLQLEDLVPRAFKKDTVWFDTRVRKGRYRFVVGMGGRAANEQGAREFYEVLKSGSR